MEEKCQWQPTKSARNSMDLTDVYHFCTLDYAATPMIKNIYNTEVVSVNEMKESLEVVFDFAKKLDDGKLSPLEKLMFILIPHLFRGLLLVRV